MRNALTVDDLINLVEVGRNLAEEVELKALFQRILDTACTLTDSPDSSIILSDDARRMLYIAHATGEDAEMLMTRWGRSSEKGIPLVGSKAGSVFRSLSTTLRHMGFEFSVQPAGVC